MNSISLRAIGEIFFSDEDEERGFQDAINGLDFDPNNITAFVTSHNLRYAHTTAVFAVFPAQPEFFPLRVFNKLFKLLVIRK